MKTTSEFTLSELDTLIDAYSLAAEAMGGQPAATLNDKAAYFRMERGNIARGDLAEADPNDHEREGYQHLSALQNADIKLPA